jgi:phosphoribosyl 1,2-cyclic phosphodiesterase
MEIAVLGSGSAGNATLVRSGGTTILLEAGLSAKQIAERARLAGHDPDGIAALFVSHAHADHVKGAPVFSRRHRVPAFVPEATMETIRKSWKEPPRFFGREELAESGVVEVGPMRVRTFPVPHDADGTIGYVVEAEGMRFGYVTDLGHVTTLVVERLRGCDALLIEMNHDPDLLREGPYPWEVKQRISSRHGHLSNEEGASLLERAIGPATRSIFLAHLSEINNQPGIALASARLAAERAGRGDLGVFAAGQDHPSPPVRL